MLRPKQFRPFEKTMLWGIALLLLGAAIAALYLAVQSGHWQLALASAAITVLAGLYYYAARRGRPL